MTFEEWLDEEYPFHDVYDHETLGAYDRWKKDLKGAYEAGWDEGINAVYKLERG